MKSAISKSVATLAVALVVVLGVLVYAVRAPDYRRAKQFHREHPGCVQYHYGPYRIVDVPCDGGR